MILDENGKRWDVKESLAASREAHAMRPQPGSDDVILERWRIELSEPSREPPVDLGSILPTVYKKSIVLFRSLFTYSKFLPAWKFARRNLKLRPNPALRIKYRILEGSGTREGSEQDHLTVPLHESSNKVVDSYSFGVTESPAGPFSVQVTYRTSCDFRVDDSEALLSSRFMGADDEIFRPSLPSEMDRVPHTETGSVPVEKVTVEYPDCTRAYGSLSSFHQIGPTTGASPISALRAAREGATSPTASDSSSRRVTSAGKVSPVGRAAVLAGEGAAVGRRPSVSFQPFKAPPLSASPALVDSPLGASPRPGSSRPPTSDSKNMPPPSIPARKPAAAHDNAIASSNSASPKPAPPITRYSSSFGHRRGRHSGGGANKTEDDNSSGKASAASSAAQPGSGLLTEAVGTSAESIHADDENISAFLKLLDSRKDLLNPENSSVLDATRRTNALTRFQRMRESNAALSDSMSSSLVLQRSNNSLSKQLSGAPPMVAGTSASTASSPGKAMSPHTPHTPHTPAIPSRLSSNSIVDYNEMEGRQHRLSHEEHDSPIEENTNEEPALGRTASTAIDIPTSPRISAHSFRRPRSAAPRRTMPADDDELFPFGMRSVSLGNEDRSQPSLSSLLRQQELDKTSGNPPPRERQSGDQAAPSSSTTDPYREVDTQKAPSSGPTPTSSSSNHHLYQPRFGHSRRRGSSGGPHSVSSTSSSLARGPIIPPHLSERDTDRDGNGSGSNSGNSTLEARRGSGQRSASGRAHPPQALTLDDEEPLLFTMSDFGVSRRSLEEGRQGHGQDISGTSGSRRGSGRRGGAFPGFHAWS